MRREHLERLHPICPTCSAAERGPSNLELGTVVRADGDDVLEGVLLCPERLCRREHPIIDGIPVVVTELTSWASHQLDSVLYRDDLSPFMESLLGDAAGPGSNLDRERTNLSGYGRGHWGDLDPDEPLAGQDSFAELVAQALALLDSAPTGTWIDLGCAVGRGTVEIARRTGDLAVGVDLNFSMLRVAERVRRESRALFPLRRVGVVYDRRDFEVPDIPGERISFWCCDAGVLPFPNGAFAGALSLNLLDCMPSPLGHLIELGRVLELGAPALMATPYDWAPTVTSVGAWIGGHSQRSDAHGSSAAELRRILSPDAEAGVDTGLVVTGERDGLRWRVYSTERAAMDYELDLLRLERKP